VPLLACYDYHKRPRAQNAGQEFCRHLQELLSALKLPTNISIGQVDVLQGAEQGSPQVRPATMGLSGVTSGKRLFACCSFSA